MDINLSYLLSGLQVLHLVIFKFQCYKLHCIMCFSELVEQALGPSSRNKMKTHHSICSLKILETTLLLY